MQKFKYLTLLVVLAISTLSFNASAYDFEVGGICYNIISSSDKTAEGTYKSASYDSYQGNIDIPTGVEFSEIKFKVTAIGSNAFYYCTSLTSITIPNSVTSIENSAFKDCTKLNDI